MGERKRNLTAILAAAKSALGIKSPSKEFAKEGKLPPREPAIRMMRDHVLTTDIPKKY